MRLFAENIGAFLAFLEEAQGSGTPLDGNVSKWMANQMPPDVTVGALIWFKDVVNKALDMKAEEIAGKD